MAKGRRSYPSDVSDEEWAFCAPYLTLMKEDAPQREHSLRELYNGLRWFVRAGCPWRRSWTAARCNPRRRAGRGAKKRKGSKVHAATGQRVRLAYVDQGYTGEQPAADAAQHGLKLEVVKHAEAKRGFVLLPRRWVVERSFAWAARFRRLARDYESLASTLSGYHWLAFSLLMLSSLFQKSP